MKLSPFGARTIAVEVPNLTIFPDVVTLLNDESGDDLHATVRWRDKEAQGIHLITTPIAAAAQISRSFERSRPSLIDGKASNRLYVEKSMFIWKTSSAVGKVKSTRSHGSWTLDVSRDKVIKRKV